METPKIGSIGWMDLTVPDADSLKDFYAAVVGWTPEALSMGEYSDYVLKSEGGGVGVCHARGANANIPPVWMPYFIVANLDESLAHVERLGGKRVAEIRSYGPTARYCMIQDPQGVYCTLFQP